MISDKFLIEEKKLLKGKKIDILRRIDNINLYMTPYFFYKSKNIKIDIDGKVRFDLENNEYKYISFIEQNLDFNIPPSISIFESESDLNQIFIDAKVKGNVEAKIIKYTNFEKVSVIDLKLNKLNKVKHEKGTIYRLVFRVKGEGILKVNSIVINNQLLYGTIFNNKLCAVDNIIGWTKNDNSNISVIENRIIYNRSDKHEYIYYDNAKFIEKKLKENTKIEFLIDNIQNIDIELHIMSYKKDGTKVVHEIMKPNTLKYIDLKPSLDLKIALRVKGKGECCIKKISVANIELWENKDINKILNSENIQCSYNKNKVYLNENIDTAKYKNITYNPNLDIYKSYLKGKNYDYINIFSQNINVDKDTFFYVKVRAIKSDSIKLTGIVKVTQSNGNYEYIEIVNNQGIVKIDEKICKIEGFARIQNSGIFKKIAFSFEEYNYNPTKILDLNLSKENWFNKFKNNELSINLKDRLEINVNSNDGKVKYISYLENNNSFNLLPKHEIIAINDNMIYRIEPRMTLDENLNVYLMAIFYDEKDKLSVIQLANNKENIIQPPKGSKSIRLALRINGNGVGYISKIGIKEFKKINYNTPVSIIDKSELSYIGLEKPKKIKEFNMAVIMDEFTTASYEPECNLIKLSPTSWKAELIQNDVDLLFVESAWKGNGGIWFKKVGDYGYENNKELFDIIEWCNMNNIPTVFWNKEDPVHFERFIHIAKRFDLILTTDKNSVSNYKKYAGDKIIDALPFAAQPTKNNPIKLFEKRIEKACFAGSYYKLHEERAKDTEIILDEVAEFGLDIYDRNYEAAKKGTMPNHVFPDRFKPYIKGSLKYNEIDKAYKGYKLMVNLNTVKHSPTMFARRVYEGLACGTPVISNYSEGIKSIFGDLVYIVENEGDMRDSIQKLMSDDTYYAHVQMMGMREVFEKHTYTHRLKFILEKLNLRYEDNKCEVTLLAKVNSKDEFEKILDIYYKQNYKSKKLAVIISKFDGYIELFKKYNTDDISIFVKSYMHNYNNISEFIKTEFLSLVSPNNFYGENYLRDLVNSTKYTNADIIGKSAFYTTNNGVLDLINKDNEFIFTNKVNTLASIIKPNVFDYNSVDEIIDNIYDIHLNMYANRGKAIFSSDKYNFIENYYKESLNKDFIKLIEI